MAVYSSVLRKGRGAALLNFHKDGIVITQTFKDQGTEYAIHMLWFPFFFLL